ncbi:hypothetical protein D1614_02775 [Maribellus luteus]|uniref:Uncharacterized protein n=1 Tax=Maribellus luteus TaxID=2305463 RepID=A0A399T7N1_9BACT|nr:hypothetical protein D1614_02775 [Maribellus luteus]
MFIDDLHLITHIPKNLKNVQIEMKDKALLCKRPVI